jgi:TonB family protein
MSLYVIKLLTDLGNLLLLISRHKKEESNIIRFHTFRTAGFSALGYIFLNSSLSPEEEKEIIRHEENHLRKNHFVDVMFIGIIRAFQWFNPVIYLLDRSLRAIHEYQADRGCLESGVAVTSYQNLLVSQVFRIRSFNLANSFSNPSLLRKRMVMMTRKPTTAIASLKMIAVVPVAVFTFLVISAYDVSYRSGKSEKLSNQTNTEVLYGSDVYNTVSEEYKEIPLSVVDKMPSFPGGDIALLQYLAANTRYPEAAKENNIQGRVIVRFCVNQNGGVDRISVLKGVDPELDAEAVRVVRTLPSFIPGSNQGKTVPVWFMVPLTFALR